MKFNRINFYRYEVIILILFKYLLDYCYVHIQADVFGYVGYTLDIMPDRTVMAWVITIFSYYLLRYKDSNIYSLFVYIIYFVSIVPFIVLYQYCSKVELWMVLLQVASLLFMRVLLVDNKQSVHNSVKSGYKYLVRYDNRKFRKGLFVFLSLYFIALFAKCGVPTLESMLFENVYDTRADANFSLLMVIVQNFTCRIIIPLVLLIAIEEKRWLAVTFVSFIQIYTFAVTGFKTFLFIPLLMIGLRAMPSLNLKNIIVLGLTGILVLGLAFYKITENGMLSAIFSDRIFFLPAYIKYCYFDYFSANEFVYYSQNSIAKILGVHSNYDTLVSYMIGNLYFDKPEMMTNTGYMADAYSNLGVFGIFLMSVILAVVIRYSKRRIDVMPSKLKASLLAIFVLFFYTLNDGHVINVLFSIGMLFVVLIISVVDFSEKKHRFIKGK